MRIKVLATAVGAVVMLGTIIVATTRSDEQTQRPTTTTLPDSPSSSQPAAERSTADLLAERIAAVPGFAQTCGEAAFNAGFDVFDTPERLIDALAIPSLPCRDEILVGMVASAEDTTFTEDQVDTLVDACNAPRDTKPGTQTCGMLVGTIASAYEPSTALTNCDALTGTGATFLPAPRLICATTYLSQSLEASDPAGIPDQVTSICVNQPDATRKICAEAMGGLLLASRDVRPNKITRVEETIKELTTLPTAVEQCRKLGDLTQACQTGIINALVVRYPMGVPSSAPRGELCKVFPQPVRGDCVTRPSPPDTAFREAEGNEEVAPQD